MFRTMLGIVAAPMVDLGGAFLLMVGIALGIYWSSQGETLEDTRDRIIGMSSLLPVKVVTYLLDVGLSVLAGYVCSRISGRPHMVIPVLGAALTLGVARVLNVGSDSTVIYPVVMVVSQLAGGLIAVGVLRERESMRIAGEKQALVTCANADCGVEFQAGRRTCPVCSTPGPEHVKDGPE